MQDPMGKSIVIKLSHQYYRVQYQERIVDLEKDTFFYVDEDLEKAIGDVAKRPQVLLPCDATYEGMWLKDQEIRQGFGTLKRRDGASYEGYFINDQFHSKGKFTFAEDDF